MWVIERVMTRGRDRTADRIRHQLPSQLQKKLPRILTRTTCSLTRLTSTLCLIRAILFLFLFGQLDKNTSKGINLIKSICMDILPLEAFALKSETPIQHCADRGFQCLQRIII